LNCNPTKHSTEHRKQKNTGRKYLGASDKNFNGTISIEITTQQMQEDNEEDL
jgi:hypothetical protein